MASTARTMKCALHSVQPALPPRSGTRLGVAAAKGATASALHSIERTDETIAAFDHLKRRDDIDPARIGIWAISEGGWIAPMTAVRRPEVAFLIMVSSPGRDAASETQYFAFNRLRQLGVGKAEAEQAIAVLRQGLRNRGRRRLTRRIPRGHRASREVSGVRWRVADHRNARDENIARCGRLLPHQSAGARLSPARRHVPGPSCANPRWPSSAIRTFKWTGARAYRSTRSPSRRRHNRDLTIKIYPGAGHNLYRDPEKEGKTSGRSQFVDGYLDLMVQWLRTRGFTTQR